MKQLPIIIPIVTSITAFVLMLLALIAGTSPGFMEEYDIVVFNTSALGKNLVSAVANDNDPTSTSDGLCDDLGFLGEPCASATAAAGALQSDVVDALNDIGNDIADKLADKLGIEQFYSLHTSTICQGGFTPNATSPDADRNVTECANALSGGYNISAILDHQLRIGPLELSLEDLGFNDDIRSAFDIVNNVAKAFVIFFIITVALTGLSMLAAIASLALISLRERVTLLVNAILSGFALVMLIISCLLITIGSRTAVSKANEIGDYIGLSAAAGDKYTIIIWVALGLMLVTFAFWISQFIRFRKGKTRGVNGSQKHVRDSEETGRHNERQNMSSIMDRVHFGRSRP